MTKHKISDKENEDVGKLLNVIERLIHIFWWVIYIVFHINYFFQSDNSTSFLVSYYAESLLVEMGLFYIFYLFMLPKLWMKGKRRWLILVVPAILAVFPLVDIAADRLVENQFQEQIQSVREFYKGLREGLNEGASSEDSEALMNVRTAVEEVPFVVDYFLRLLSAILLSIMSLVLWFAISWFKRDKIKSELKTDNLTTELLWLRSQINPHFLFNTLNNIYYLVYSKSEAAPTAVLKLSAIMRYMLYESNEPRVPLEKEVNYLNDYINLHQMRMKEDKAIQFNIKGNIEKKMIAPMLLVPFVENAFKHGSLSNQDPLVINLSIEDEAFSFEVINKYKEVPEENKDQVGGIGLENIKRRLSLIYPNRNNLSINNTENKFHVVLTLNE